MHCLTALGAVGSAAPAIHCRTVWGQWAAQFLQCTAALPGGSGQWTSGKTLPHCLGAVGNATPAMHCLTAWGAVGSGTPAMHCLTAWEQRAVQLLQCTASLPGGSGQWNSCNTLPHCLGAVDSATPAMHCPTASGQWAVQLLQCTASLPGGSGQRNSCNALPHCLGAVDSATLAMGGRSVLQGLWGCTTRRTSLGGWGVYPRGWSGHPSGPMGGHHLRRTGRTGLGGDGESSPGGRRVVGASCKAHAEPSSSNNRAHRPGGDGESSPGGGRSLLQGPWGAIIFQ